MIDKETLNINETLALAFKHHKENNFKKKTYLKVLLLKFPPPTQFFEVFNID
jgi:hypothetical protein